MLIGTIFGVFVVPVLFIIFQKLQERYGRKRRPKPFRTKELQTT